MSKALSVDLRERVVRAVVGGRVVPKSGGALWGQRVERDPLVRAAA